MSDEEIRRSICCIEQQLLIEDDSPLIHNSLSSANGKNSKYSLEVFSCVYKLSLRERID